MARTLTLEDRQKIELMRRHNTSPVKIAAKLAISQCTVYKELKRGQTTREAGNVVPGAFLVSLPVTSDP